MLVACVSATSSSSMRASEAATAAWAVPMAMLHASAASRRPRKDCQKMPAGALFAPCGLAPAITRRGAPFMARGVHTRRLRIPPRQEKLHHLHNTTHNNTSRSAQTHTMPSKMPRHTQDNSQVRGCSSSVGCRASGPHERDVLPITAAGRHPRRAPAAPRALAATARRPIDTARLPIDTARLQPRRRSPPRAQLMCRRRRGRRALPARTGRRYE